MTEPEPFRTFCHLSEYGSDGYAHLHRMIAASSPLVLWAPSSVLLDSPRCRVTPREFVRLVETGVVRVIARESWLTDRRARDEHPWPGAAWRPDVDDPLQAMYREDQGRPREERRVLHAEPERGTAWATGHLERHPELVSTIVSALDAPETRGHFPVGVVESARARAEDPAEMARRIVRDVYNHDAAIAESGTRTPFLLSPRDGEFHRLLGSVRAATDVEFPAPTSSTPLTPEQLGDLTADVLHVLEFLEHAGTPRLDRFVGGEGQRLLARWLREVRDSLERTGAADVDGEVLARLQADFAAGRLEDRWSDVLDPASVTPDGLGMALGTVGMIASPDILGACGLAVGAIPVLRSLARKLGVAQAPYNGPQWAFLYAFGSRATGRRHARLGRALDALRST